MVYHGGPVAGALGVAAMVDPSAVLDTTHRNHRHPSKSEQLFPLLPASLFLLVVAWVLYQAYATCIQFKAIAVLRMGGHHVVWTKDGLRVGVRQMENETYVDRTQNWLVRAWNLRNSGSNVAVVGVETGSGGGHVRSGSAQ